MALWLWQFWTYSFLGYLLEKGFAAATRAKKQGRKCFLLLPLCPVYGLGVVAVLLLPSNFTDSFWKLALFGGAAATAVEYAVHWLYDRMLGVFFWDYSAMPWNIQGRVCLLFSVIWGLLLAAVLPGTEQLLTPLLSGIPAGLTYGMLLLFTLDAVCSARFLLVTGDTEFSLSQPGIFWHIH